MQIKSKDVLAEIADVVSRGLKKLRLNVFYYISLRLKMCTFQHRAKKNLVKNKITRRFYNSFKQNESDKLQNIFVRNKGL